MDADGAGHLREARDRFFHVAGVDHHQVGQLVDDDDDVGQRLVLGVLGFVEERERLALLERAVVLIDVADAALRPAVLSAIPFRAWRCAKRWTRLSDR